MLRIESLENELAKEREHGRQQASKMAEQANNIAELARMLAELNRNSQLLIAAGRDGQAGAVIDVNIKRKQSGTGWHGWWHKVFKTNGNRPEP